MTCKCTGGDTVIGDGGLSVGGGFTLGAGGGMFTLRDAGGTVTLGDPYVLVGATHQMRIFKGLASVRVDKSVGVVVRQCSVAMRC